MLSQTDGARMESLAHHQLPAAGRRNAVVFLTQEATADQVHQRYRELTLAFHPDRDDGDHELMQEINLAYQRLLKKAGDIS